jgi:hypothetical protein
MKIGIDSGVIESLASTAENAEHYLRQLAREGHDLSIITGDSAVNVKCLDLYIASKSAESLVSDGVAKNSLLFPDQVNTWWDIYNHIRYEL